MKIEQLADMAVRVTQSIKTNLDLSPQDVLVQALNDLDKIGFPWTVDMVSTVILEVGKELGIEGEDVHGVIEVLQTTGKETVSDIQWNVLWQDIAQAIFLVAHLVLGFLPPKWGDAIRLVLDTYERVFKAT